MEETDLIPYEPSTDPVVILQLRTRNARLLAALQEKGLTAKQFCINVGIPYWRYTKGMNLHKPFSEDDQFKIAIYLGKPLDYLFPESLHRSIESGAFKNRVRQIGEPQLGNLSYNDSQMLEDVDRKLLKRALLEKLNPQLPPKYQTMNSRERKSWHRVNKAITELERKVIIERFGIEDSRCKTLEEVGQKLGYTRERIREFEESAIKKLRAPQNSRKLKAWLED